MRNLPSRLFLASLVVGGSASAETVRCSGHIIEQNMPKSELLEHCGSPDSESDQVTRTWVYNNLDGQKVVIYFYDNDDIERIETVFD